MKRERIQSAPACVGLALLGLASLAAAQIVNHGALTNGGGIGESASYRNVGLLTQSGQVGVSRSASYVNAGVVLEASGEFANRAWRGELYR